MRRLSNGPANAALLDQAQPALLPGKTVQHASISVEADPLIAMRQKRYERWLHSVDDSSAGAIKGPDAQVDVLLLLTRTMIVLEILPLPIFSDYGTGRLREILRRQIIPPSRLT